MSQADALLEYVTSESNDSGNIVIDSDRYIIVPESIKRVAVQFDHNIETVTFDCPRYLNGYDVSEMQIYVNYIRADDHRGSHLCTDVAIDESNPNIIHFNWTISGHVTYVDGHISFMVCIKKVDSDGNEEIHWNSEVNTDMFVSPGIKHIDAILAKYPDIITQLLQRMDVVEDVGDGIEVNTAKAAESEAKAAEYAELVKTSADGIEAFVTAASDSAAEAKISETNAAASAASAEESFGRIGDSVIQAAASAEIAKTSENIVIENAEKAVKSAEDAAKSAVSVAETAVIITETAASVAEKETNAVNSAKNAEESAVSANEAADSAWAAEDSAGYHARYASEAASHIEEKVAAASESAEAAATSETNAENSALFAQSWAVGGTGIRADEAVNNAKYWCDNAQAIVGGDFSTKEEAQGYANVAESNANRYTDETIADVIVYVDTHAANIPIQDEPPEDSYLWIDTSVDGGGGSGGVANALAYYEDKVVSLENRIAELEKLVGVV